MNRKYKEIDALLEDLNRANDAHFSWLIKIVRLAANPRLNTDDLTRPDAYTHCRLNRWLTSMLARNRTDQRYLLDIQASHREMHVRCGELVAALYTASDATQEFEAFEGAVLGFTHSMRNYRNYLLARRSSYDLLTGLPMRRTLYEAFEHVRSDSPHAKRYLMLMDIDRFKQVNDTFGHLFGDAVLSTFAQRLERAIRSCDFVCRYGGEEFIVLYCADSDTAATQAAERIRNAFADSCFQIDGESLPVTATLGVTQIYQQDTLRSALARADAALYYGKNANRNCTVFSNQQGELRKIESDTAMKSE
ncbi:diguanylate cyclase [Siccibacter turicensis]|uniref:diguanylate cyclase n=1 Tax=Siccibacter turicensis TaxID=357233 RepID=UPI0023F48501|nr:diguanylate cyclase [Siccibacter turicensis]